MNSSIKKFQSWGLLKKLIVITTTAFVLFILLSGVYWENRVGTSYYDKNIIENVDISDVDKLMIVAHPDDETIWGGGHLEEGGYLVVCFTDGYNNVRKDEFINAVTSLNNSNIPVIFDFPDKTFRKRDNWYGIKYKVFKTVDNLLKMKDWNLIVTHNKDGEYGHIHHKAISEIVSSECEKLGKQNNLYYFGKYHSKKKISKYESQMTPLDDKLYNKKIDICKGFSSQKWVIDGLQHMLKYENWTAYNGQ